MYKTSCPYLLDKKWNEDRYLAGLSIDSGRQESRERMVIGMLWNLSKCLCTLSQLDLSGEPSWRKRRDHIGGKLEHSSQQNTWSVTGEGGRGPRVDIPNTRNRDL